MQYISTIQSRGYTSRAGYAGIDAVLDNCAELYNAALQHRHDAWQKSGKTVSYYDQCREFTILVSVMLFRIGFGRNKLIINVAPFTEEVQWQDRLKPR